MANTTFTTSTYEGQAALPFVAPAILSADTLANGWVSVLDNVRFKANLRKASGVAVTARSCTWNAGPSPLGGSLDISDVQLVTSQLQVQEQICNKDLAQTWAGAQMRGAYADTPADYVQFLSSYVAAKVAADIEGSIWQGNYDPVGGTTYAYTSFDGLMHHIVDASPDRETVSTLPLAAETVANTSVGILDALAILTSGAEGAPDAIAGDPDTKIFMSRKSAQLYYQALASSTGYNLPFLNDGLVTRYSGYDIYTPAGFPDNTLLIGKSENFYFGTNLMTDMTAAKFMNLAGVTGDDVTRIAMLFDGGTQVVDHDSYAVWRHDAP
jgi:hypothetical protein